MLNKIVIATIKVVVMLIAFTYALFFVLFKKLENLAFAIYRHRNPLLVAFILAIPLISGLILKIPASLIAIAYVVIVIMLISLLLISLIVIPFFKEVIIKFRSMLGR